MRTLEQSGRVKKVLLKICILYFLNLEILVKLFNNFTISNVSFINKINDTTIIIFNHASGILSFIKFNISNKCVPNHGHIIKDSSLVTFTIVKKSLEKWLAFSSPRYVNCFCKITPRCDLVNFDVKICTPHRSDGSPIKTHFPHQSKGNIFNVLSKLTPYLTTYYCRICLILANDIETNPGPNHNNLVISSYNLQGCGDKKKLKRVNNIFHKLPYKFNCI